MWELLKDFLLVSWGATHPPFRPIWPEGENS